MNYSLLPHNFKKIGIILIVISITYFLVNLFYPIEIPFLNSVEIYPLLPSSFPVIEGVSKGENFNPRFFTIILLIGLFVIYILSNFKPYFIDSILYLSKKIMLLSRSLQTHY